MIWDDGVAPETALDFDAQHVSSTDGLKWLFGALGAYASTALFINYVWQPESFRQAVSTGRANHQGWGRARGGWGGGGGVPAHGL